MDEAEIFRRMSRAMERRFGISSLPFGLSLAAEGFGGQRWRMIDLESGSWIDAWIYPATRRIFICNEYDGEASR